jgi:thiamine-monophosphate kinase
MLLGRNRAASSCIDLSDGLADGVRQIAESSGVGITLDAKTLSLADEWLSAAITNLASTGRRPEFREVLDGAIGAGDDYELLFTSRPSHRGRLRLVRQQGGDVPITRIGVVTKGRDVLLKDESGVRELPSGYEHWPNHR